MVTLSYITLSLVVGYTVAVGLAMMATFTMTAARREFVAKNNRIRRRYKYVQEIAWLVCATAGGYAAALINGPPHAWLVGASLAAVMVLVLWTNVWEMRQRGLGHQISMSLMSAAGVAIGFVIHLR
jgi:uncharacterized membrane protein YfcA